MAVPTAAATPADTAQRSAALTDPFARQVQDALAHLYDTVYLGSHALAPTPAARQAGRAGPDPGAALRARLLGAMERLRPAVPERPAGAADRAWRAYRLLTLRYVEALEAAEVRRRLGLGKTQYYAELGRAVAALVALLREEPGTPEGAPLPGLPGLPSAAAPLVPPLTSFVGRERELEAVTDLLEGGARLLTLTGPGGSGKTRLAIEAAHRFALLPDSWTVRLVELAPVGDGRLVASTIARTLGLRADSAADLGSAVNAAVRAGRLLLVLDNFEHLLVPAAAAGTPLDAAQASDAASLVSRLLAACPRLTCLVTSREPLHMTGEQRLDVTPLPLPPLLDTAHMGAPQRLEHVRDAAAVRLFAERVRAVQPAFTLTAANAALVAEICRRLDGLPLAIELAAAWCRALPLPALLRRLDRRLPLLTGGPRDAPARQQTLRRAIAWSYDRLGEAEQALFRWAGVFAGGCSAETASLGGVSEGAADEEQGVLDALVSLADKSLLRARATEGEPRFVMLETVREFALEQAASFGELEALRRRHARYFLDLVARAAPHLHRAGQLRWLRRLEQEADNVRAALDWCVEQGERGDAEATEWGLRRAAELAEYWMPRGETAEGRQWLARLLALPAASARTPARAWALYGAAAVSIPTGGTTTLFEESLSIAREVGDQELVAQALSWGSGGDDAPLALARARLEEALALSESNGDPQRAAVALYLLGYNALSAGDLSGAQRHFERSRAAGAPLGDRWHSAVIARGLARVEMLERSFPAAQRLYDEALRLHREVGDRLGEAATLGQMGDLARAQSDFATARARITDSLRIHTEIGALRGCARVLERLASLEAAVGQLERAVRLTGAAAALREAIGIQAPPDASAEVELLRGDARQRLGPEAAEAAWETGRATAWSDAIAEALGEPPPDSR